MKKKNLDIMTLKSNLQKVSPNHSLMTNKHEPTNMNLALFAFC